MTKKELNIIKKVYNEVWQDLLNREISVLREGESVDSDNYRTNLLFAQTAISDLVKALGINFIDLITDETENLIEDQLTLQYSQREGAEQ